MPYGQLFFKIFYTETHLFAKHQQVVNQVAGLVQEALFIAVDKGGKIVGVAPAANAETPQFWKRLTDAKFFKAWKGLTPAQAATKKVDAITGATFSSKAVIQTVQATAKNIKK